MDQDWIEYHCKSGQSVFLYNKVTGEHRWSHGLGHGIESRIIHGRPVIYKEYRSSSVQTDDNGCTNGCMSMYINRDASHVADTSTTYVCIPSGQQSTVLDNQDSLNLEPGTIEDRDEKEQRGDFVPSMVEAHVSLRRNIAPNSDDGDDDDNDEDGGLDSDDGHRDDDDYGDHGSDGDDGHHDDGCNGDGKGNDYKDVMYLLYYYGRDSGSNGDGDCARNNDDLDDNKDEDEGTEDYACGDGNVKGDGDDEGNEVLVNSDQDESSQVDSNGTHDNSHGDVLSCQESESFVKHASMQGRHKELSDKTSSSSTANNVDDNNAAVNAHGANKSPSHSTDGIDVILQEKSNRQHHECSVCKKVFKYKCRLELHAPVHTGQKPFDHKCSVCEKTFSRKENLHRHLKTHSGEKPFQCSHCKKRFATKQNCIVHIRTHTGEKPFECSYCKKAFAGKGTLKYHMRTHTGEKPFECSYCKKLFATKPYLKRHVTIHTRDLFI